MMLSSESGETWIFPTIHTAKSLGNYEERFLLVSQMQNENLVLWKSFVVVHIIVNLYNT